MILVIEECEYHILLAHVNPTESQEAVAVTRDVGLVQRPERVVL